MTQPGRSARRGAAEPDKKVKPAILEYALGFRTHDKLELANILQMLEELQPEGLTARSWPLAVGFKAFIMLLIAN